MVIKREELYDKVAELCDGEYAIGMHGIDYYRLREFSNLDREYVIRDVMNNGLKVFSARTIHGTVRFFGRIDTEEDEEAVRLGLEKYRYGSDDYFVVAVPSVFRNSEGEELFLGCPNLKSRYIDKMGTTGNQRTTLLDNVILQSDGIYDQRIDRSYILGFCQVLEDGRVNFVPNPKHMAFNGGVVSDEVFQDAMNSMNLYRYYGFDITPSMLSRNVSLEDEEKIKNVMRDIEKELDNTSNYTDRSVSASLWETLRQVINERNLHKRSRTVEEVAQEEKVSKERGITVSFFRGDYFNVDDTIFVKFSYESEADEEYFKKLFNEELLKKYGSSSDRREQGKGIMMPYLEDIFGNFSVSEYGTRVGGTNIPDDLVETLGKRFIEEGCKLRVGDREMNGNFDREAFLGMISDIPREAKGKGK